MELKEEMEPSRRHKLEYQHWRRIKNYGEPCLACFDKRVTRAQSSG